MREDGAERADVEHREPPQPTLGQVDALEQLQRAGLALGGPERRLGKDLVEVFGDGEGRMRRDPFLPKEPLPAPPTDNLSRLLCSFREAVSSALYR